MVQGQPGLQSLCPGEPGEPGLRAASGQGAQGEEGGGGYHTELATSEEIDLAPL